jgi:hypothetical protein
VLVFYQAKQQADLLTLQFNAKGENSFEDALK